MTKERTDNKIIVIIYDNSNYEKALKKRSTGIRPFREEILHQKDAVLRGLKDGNMEGSFGAGKLNQIDAEAVEDLQ